MVNQFIFVRHGQAEHNEAFHATGGNFDVFKDLAYTDAALTEKGSKEASQLAEKLSGLYPNGVAALWTSPLSRCIDTANKLINELNIHDVYAHDALMETQKFDHTCNFRLSKEKLFYKYPLINMDYLPDIPAVWTKSENNYSTRSRMIMIVQLLRNTYKNTNLPIIVVSHAMSLFQLLGKKISNCEYVVLTDEEIDRL